MSEKRVCSNPDCGKVTSDVYYRKGNGRTSKDPLCRDCFEDACRRDDRDSYEEDKRLRK